MYHLRCVWVHLLVGIFANVFNKYLVLFYLSIFIVIIFSIVYKRNCFILPINSVGPTPLLHNWMMCVLMWYSGPYSGRGGADCHDETQRSDGTWWGHAGVSGGHYRLLSPEGAHPDFVPSHRAPEWAERREGDTPSHTSCKKNTCSLVLTLFLHTSFKSRW